ncbi:pseudouridine synthase [Cohnella sp. JJ-181]|uniref:pseudouridine synthase n=1 Tax=Cohnella rhizoplanae TaxID=2974897 RepID=UPI0022FF76B3|nr:pseudouridine synthase [Cohnella sp. JJ-181]CAI6048541.1 Ribosomal small subunit pseudouridine synthase A [Cohnella sp. JJ-181]
MKTKMRLDKMLGNLGYGTRSVLKGLVRQGAVTVNGNPVKDPGMQIDPHADEVVLEGERIVYRDTVYVMLHKPAGFVSATEDRRERTVLELLPEDLAVFSPFPVGRLDKDTEGLLLLTNDGKLSHDLLSPRKHVPKTYQALVAGRVGSDDIATFATGVTLDDGYVTLPAELRVLDDSATESRGDSAPGDPEEAVAPAERAIFTAEAARARLDTVPALQANRTSLQEAVAAGEPLNWVEVTIGEGKYHQVKRMFESVGKKVLYLRRQSMGPLPLDESLKAGEWRELTEEELERLRNYKKAGERS